MIRNIEVETLISYLTFSVHKLCVCLLGYGIQSLVGPGGPRHSEVLWGRV